MMMECRVYEKLFARAPVYDPVFSYLSPRSLARVALTCRVAYEAIAEFKSRAFDINRHFSRYFAHPLAFRSLQARTNTLVSGSNALQFLDRTFYPQSDLDLYTHPGHSFEVACFLVEAERYYFVPRESQEDDWKEAIGDDFDGTERRNSTTATTRRTNHSYTDSMRAVWSFEKTGRDDDCLKIQVIEAVSSPLEVILGFHSTCVMNFITADAAYSLYPIATFEERCGLSMPCAESSAKAIQKYIQRGWRIYLVPPGRPTESSFFITRVRWVGDRHTWVVPLNQTGVKERPQLSTASAPLTFDPVLCNGWRMRFHNELEKLGCETHYYPLRTTLFRYNYAIPEEEVSLTIRAWATIQGRHLHRTVDTDNWVWFDSDIPSFLPKRDLTGQIRL